MTRNAQALDQVIGDRVRARRLEIGMSQERLAALIGVTFQQVQKYERGANRIAVSRLVDIADALGQPAGAFVHGLGKGQPLCPTHASVVAASLATPDGAKLAALFARVKSRPVRQRLLNLVLAVVEAAP